MTVVNVKPRLKHLALFFFKILIGNPNKAQEGTLNKPILSTTNMNSNGIYYICKYMNRWFKVHL